jgi:ATP/maltotriose-dependent transcriptional regulator MalT
MCGAGGVIITCSPSYCVRDCSACTLSVQLSCTGAAGWFEAHGLVDEALHHARAAGDFDWVANMVEVYSQAQLLRSEIGTVERWLSALPPAVIRSRPRLGVTAAVWALIGGEMDRVEPLLRPMASSGATVKVRDRNSRPSFA